MTSMRSNSGCEMVCSELAVVMNSTLDKSKGSSMKWSLKVLFCAGSSTSSRAEDGSPRKSVVILSISSIKNTGLAVPASIMPRIMRPGIAPT